MATGRLGAVDLAATTATTVYTVPASKIATVIVNFCNRNAATVKVRLAHIDSGGVANEDYLEYDVSIDAQGVLERTGIVMAAGAIIMAYSDTANVSVQVYGFEETA